MKIVSDFNYFNTKEVIPDFAINLLQTTLPDNLYSLSRVPDLRQCAGTNRFWGSMLGLAAFESLPPALQNDEIKLILIKIPILTRTVFVVDDYLDDEYTNEEEQKIIGQWLENLLKELMTLYSALGVPFNTFLEYRQLSRDAGKRRDLKSSTDNIFQLSVDKFTLFVNPFRFNLPKIFQDPNFNKFLEYYFFACQILDDFFDLEEDIVKKSNNNIFITQLSRENQEQFVKHRGAFALDIVKCIESNFITNKLGHIAATNKVSAFYYDALMFFIDKKKREFSYISSNNLKIFSQMDFKEWYISDECFLGIDWGDLVYPDKILLEDMRPELMQTQYFGLLDISEV